ncbi:hypothetical protein GF373_03525, partial [bacterium]|nr:hypothetical protein [bacterium]
PRYWLDAICPTFHGRDIFSPVAAYVAQGVPLADMGEEIDNPVRLDAPPVQKTPTSLLGEIRYIDHFGNLISNIESSLFEDWLRQAHAAKQDVSIFVEGITIQGISNTYSDKDVGNPVAVFDGYGRLEVAFRNGNAQQMTNGKIHSSIRLTINT